MSLDELRAAESYLVSRVASRGAQFTAEALLFGKQRGFVTSPAKYKTAVCSRRAGKTIGCAFALVDTALRKPGCFAAYLTLDRTDAKQILWNAVLDLNNEHGLGGKSNESDLTLRLPNGSTVLLAGAGDERKIKKRRGLPFGIVIIDEAQNFSEGMKSLVEDVLEPALMDFDGQLLLTGTPGPIPVGYFYEASQSKGWEHHHWTAFDNPWIARKSGLAPEEHMRSALARRGVTVDDPSVQREWFGRWVVDLNSLVFKYEGSRNTFRELPACRKPWSYVVGIDLGYEDADAIAVLAFNDESPNAYLAEEWIGTKQTITQLTERVQELIKRRDPLTIVWDTGGLGKKIATEVTQRTGIPLRAAEKTRKFEYIELLNDAMRSGRFYAKAGSRFAEDALKVEWDRERSTPDRMVISDRYHSDICDAVLYAFRESLHWLHEPPQAKPQPGTPEALQAEEDENVSRLEQEMADQKAEEAIWTNGGWGWQ